MCRVLKGPEHVLHTWRCTPCGLQEELAVSRAALEQAQRHGAGAPTAEALAQRDHEIRWARGDGLLGQGEGGFWMYGVSETRAAFLAENMSMNVFLLAWAPSCRQLIASAMPSIAPLIPRLLCCTSVLSPCSALATPAALSKLSWTESLPRHSRRMPRLLQLSARQQLPQQRAMLRWRTRRRPRARQLAGVMPLPRQRQRKQRLRQRKSGPVQPKPA